MGIGVQVFSIWCVQGFEYGFDIGWLNTLLSKLMAHVMRLT